MLPPRPNSAHTPSACPCRRNRRRCLLAASTAICFLPAICGAQATWVGNGSTISGGSTLWSSPGNWSPHVPASGENVFFGTGFNSGSIINSFGSRAIGLLTIDSASAFNLANFSGSGNTITLDTAQITRTADSSNTQIISSNLSLPAEGTWNINGSGALDVSGNVSATIPTIGLNQTGAGSVQFTGQVNLHHLFIQSGAAEVASTGTVGLTSADDIGAPTEALSVGYASSSASLLIDGQGVVNCTSQTDGTAAIDGPANAPSSVTVDGQSAKLLVGNDAVIADLGSAQMFVQNNASFTSGDFLSIGLSGGQGTLTIQSGGKVTAPYVSVGVYSTSSTGTILVTGPKSSLTAATNLLLGGPNSSTSIGNGFLTISNGGSVSTAITALLGTQSSITINGGSLTTGLLTSVGNTGPITLTTDPSGGIALTIGTFSGSATFASSITGSGSIYKTNSSTQVLSGLLTYSGNTLIDGGTLALLNGLPSTGGTVTLSTGGNLVTSGFVNRPLTGNGNLVPTSTLFIGDPARHGINFAGTLNVSSNLVELLDSASATLSGIVNFANGGRLDSLNGITSSGTLTMPFNGSATITNNFVNNGFIFGPGAAGQSLVFQNDLSGTGNASGNITLLANFFPGAPASAAAIHFGGATTFGSTAILHTDLGGLTPGSQYDQLQITGPASLSGILDIDNINSFIPLPGQSFTVMTYGSHTGAFNGIVNQTAYLGLSFIPTYTATSLTLTASATPGDANLDGTINSTDFSTLAANFGATGKSWVAGDFNGDGIVNALDFNALATHYAQSTNPFANVPTSNLTTLVPEPGELCFALFVGALPLRRRFRP